MKTACPLGGGGVAEGLPAVAIEGVQLGRTRAVCSERGSADDRGEARLAAGHYGGGRILSLDQFHIYVSYAGS